MAAPENSMKTLESLCVDFLGTDTAICNWAAKNSDFLQFWDTLMDPFFQVILFFIGENYRHWAFLSEIGEMLVVFH